METMRRFSRRTFVAWVGGASAGFYLFGRRSGDERAGRARADPRRHARSDRCDEVRHADADPAGDAEGSDDHAAWRQARRLLRDLDAADRAADPPAGPARDDGVGLRRESGGEQPRPAHPQRALADDRGQVEQAGPGEVDQRARGRKTGTTCRTCCRSIRRCTGRTRPAAPPVATRDRTQPVDPTPGRYAGPVPIVTHVHGAVGVGDDSDGYAEAWYLPAANNIPAGYATEGTWYDFFAGKAAAAYGVAWGPGFATFQYPNENRASTIWYHDHALGMTRLNVYAGPAGFYLVRGGPAGDDAVLDSRTGLRRRRFPAPRRGRTTSSRPTSRTARSRSRSRIARSTLDGSLFYPDSREFFDGIVGDFIPDGEFSPIWNPEFFGNMIMVNGNTWPFLDGRAAPLPAAVPQRLPVALPDPRLRRDPRGRGLADRERGRVPRRSGEPHGRSRQPAAHGLGRAGGRDRRLHERPRRGATCSETSVPTSRSAAASRRDDFDVADPDTTGQIMQFRVVAGGRASTTRRRRSSSSCPRSRRCRRRRVTRPLALIEKAGIGHDADGNEVEGPVEALLGNVVDEVAEAKLWMDPVSENPAVGATEVWEFYNTTADAHPMHVHEVVVRGGEPRGPRARR